MGPMTTSEPTYLEQLQAAKRARRKRVLTGVGIMTACVLVAWLVIYFNAGKWGVPGFGFKNEYGSRCKNQLVGHLCSPITAKEVTARSGVTIPESAELLQGSWAGAPAYELEARVAFPADMNQSLTEELKQKFGDCQQHAATPLYQVPGLKDHCIRTHEGKAPVEGRPSPHLWNVASAVQPDGRMVVHFSIRAR